MAKKQVVDIDFENLARGINVPLPVLDGDIVSQLYVVQSIRSYRSFAKEALETSTTGVGTFATKLSFNTVNLPLGNYEIMAHYLSRTSQSNRGMTVRIREGAANILDSDEPFYSNTADRRKGTLYATIENTSGIKTITLEFKPGNTGNNSSTTAFLANAYLELKRILPA